MIRNAADVPLNASFDTLPDVSDVLPGWFQPLQFDVVTKSLVDYELQEVIVSVRTEGVRQPLNAQQLSIKPEGQRAWRWETLHCLPNVKLKIDDIVVFDTRRYRVMGKWDWSEYGYCEYELCEAYNDGANAEEESR